MLACKRHVWDTPGLVSVAENPSAGSTLAVKIDPKNSFMYATSQSKTDIQELGMDFNNIISLAEKSVGGKIHYIEISPEIKENTKFLVDKYPGLHLDHTFAYAHTTKSILLTFDTQKRKSCETIGCKHFWSDSA